MAQITAASQGVTHNMPPGMSPPFMIRFNATDVPIMQLGLASPKRTESELDDFATNFMRVPLATVHGVTMPPAYGGVPRVINVDIDPQALFAKGLSPADVSAAINQQNVILPSGTARMGAREYYVRLNSTPGLVEGSREHSDQAGERRDGLSARRRAGARRRRRADEHRARERPSRHVSHDAQERQGVDARHRRSGEGRCCRAFAPACRPTSASTSWATSRSYVRATIAGVLARRRDRRAC